MAGNVCCLFTRAFDKMDKFQGMSTMLNSMFNSFGANALFNLAPQLCTWANTMPIDMFTKAVNVFSDIADFLGNP